MSDLADEQEFIELKKGIREIDPERREAIRQMIMQDPSMKEEPKPEMVNPSEFAARVGVSPNTVRRWIRDGVVKGKKIGPRKWFIPISEAERILKVEE